MGFLNRNSISEVIFFLVTFTLIIIIFFSLTAVVINAAVFLVPAGAVIWAIYKSVMRIRNLLKLRASNHDLKPASVMTVSSEENIERAISENKVIDVEFSEVD